MGAITVKLDMTQTHSQDSWTVISGTLTMSSSYAPGGDSYTPGLFGLGQIHDLLIWPSSGYVLQGIVSTATSGGLVKAFWSGFAAGTLDEVTAGTNLSTITARFHAYGW